MTETDPDGVFITKDEMLRLFEIGLRRVYADEELRSSPIPQFESIEEPAGRERGTTLTSTISEAGRPDDASLSKGDSDEKREG
jgi:hypothetical protein